MITQSRFIQIHPRILLEYIYTDVNNPEVYNTNISSFEILKNNYVDKNYLFSSHNSLVSINNRDNSAVPINANNTTYVSLDIDGAVPYNDTDVNLTNTIQTVQTFTPDYNIPYDTVKYHFQSGFSFEDFEGLVAEISITRRDSNKINLSSLYIQKNGNLFTPNPSPLLISEKLYVNYIEVKIPSFYFMNIDLSASPTNSNLLGYKISDNKGFIKTSTIDFNILGCYNTIKDNGFIKFNVRNLQSASIGQLDEFMYLSAKVIEAPNADYFELYGEYAGVIFEDFLQKLNAIPGNDYIVFHDIIVKEQLNFDFIQTSQLTLIQTNDFGTPVTFRPVIKNSSISNAYIIEYTLRLINKLDNTQIIRKSQYISTEPRKYGLKLQRLYLGTVPTITKIYNKIEENNGSNIQINQKNILDINANNGESIIKTNFVNIFRDRINIKVSSTPIQIQAQQNEQN
jgi:hypothetical protein